MKWTALVTTAALTVGSLAPAIAAPPKNPVERSPDVLRPHQTRNALVRPAASTLLAPSAITAAAAPTVEEVGDPDSFGRNVTYLGLAQTQSIVIQDDCSTSDPTLERCVVANPAPASTTFNEAGLATVSLPTKASKSLLCFTLTPFVFNQWVNNTGAPANARFSANVLISIDNDVLDDPALVDPNTGVPYGGVLNVALSTFSDTHTLQPGETDAKSLFMTRACIGGIVSKRALVENYGLSDAQATQFFKKPMTLTFGARGTVALSEFSNYFYGFRLYGD